MTLSQYGHSGVITECLLYTDHVKAWKSRHEQYGMGGGGQNIGLP